MSTKVKLLLSIAGYGLVCWHCLHHQAEASRRVATQPHALAPAPVVPAAAPPAPVVAAAPPAPAPVVPAAPPAPEPAPVVPAAPPSPAPEPAPPAPSGDALASLPARLGTRAELQRALDAVVGARRVEFASGSDVIDPASHALLDDVAEVLRRAPALHVEVQGHTDNVGNPVANRDMSARRAAAVARYLAARGVRYRRILALGHGADRPVADNDTPEGRQRNRRIRFLALPGGR